MRAYDRERYAKNPLRSKGTNLKTWYGITLEEYRAMHEAQNGLCAICKQPETKTRLGTRTQLSVDHCHVSKAVRGLLCADCNRAIGMMKDNPTLLRAAATYLEAFAVPC